MHTFCKAKKLFVFGSQQVVRFTKLPNYLTAALVELAGNAARDHKKSRADAIDAAVLKKQTDRKTKA